MSAHTATTTVVSVRLTVRRLAGCVTSLSLGTLEHFHLSVASAFRRTAVTVRLEPDTTYLRKAIVPASGGPSSVFGKLDACVQSRGHTII